MSHSKNKSQDAFDELGSILRGSREFQTKDPARLRNKRRKRSKLGQLQAERDLKKWKNAPKDPKIFYQAVLNRCSKNKKPSLRSVIYAARWVARQLRPVTPRSVANRIADVKSSKEDEIYTVSVPMGGKSSSK